MKLSKCIINFSYQPFLIRVARFLHLRLILRRMYYWFFRPKNGIAIIYVEGIKAEFYVNNPIELRITGVISRAQPGGEQAVLRKTLELLQEGDVAYDIGANLGTHTIFMAKRVKDSGSVVAFEPEEKSYAALLGNIELNKLRNVLPLRLALGEKTCAGRLHWKDKIIGSYSLIGSDLKEIIDQEEEIKIVSADALRRERGLAIPKAVKIDVEGYEYYVIRGMRETLSDERCRMVCCEVHPDLLAPKINPDMLIGLLKGCGFKRIERTPEAGTFHLFCYKE